MQPTARRADIDSFYTCQHPEEFRINWRAFYMRAEARTDAVRSRWPHELDIAYGPAERQRLDIYLPSAAGSVPVLVFLHGGGFREGDPALYGYLAQPYLERGIAFVSMGYRLTPDAYLPETFADVEHALAWCVENLPSRGVDITRLALSGHSAGAILSAHLAVRADWLRRLSLPQDLLGAVVPISGVYDFTDPANNRDFVRTAEDRQASSPLLRISRTPPPMLVAYGSDENQPTYGRDSRRLVEEARAHGGTAEFLELEGMTHADTADALGDASTPLFQRTLALISRISAPLPG